MHDIYLATGLPIDRCLLFYPFFYPYFYLMNARLSGEAVCFQEWGLSDKNKRHTKGQITPPSSS